MIKFLRWAVLAALGNRILVNTLQNEGAWFGLKTQWCFVSDQIVSKVLISSFQLEIENIKIWHDKDFPI